MSSFTAPLNIEPLATGWRTTRAYSFWCGEPGTGVEIVVPAETVTDLGTIPRVLWWLLPRDDPRWAAAFVLHDELCERRTFPRMTAAGVFLEALFVLARTNGTPRRSLWRVWAMFVGVLFWALLRPYPRA